MSGLKHSLGDDFYWEGEEVKKIVWPTIGEADRAFAVLAAKVGGVQRGFRDGMTISTPSRPPDAAPIPPAHAKLHATHAVRGLAALVSGTGLSAVTLTRTWLAGYEEGVMLAFSTLGQAHSSPGGDPGKGYSEYDRLAAQPDPDGGEGEGE